MIKEGMARLDGGARALTKKQRLALAGFASTKHPHDDLPDDISNCVYQHLNGDEIIEVMVAVGRYTLEIEDGEIYFVKGEKLPIREALEVVGNCDQIIITQAREMYNRLKEVAGDLLEGKEEQ